MWHKGTLLEIQYTKKIGMHKNSKQDVGNTVLHIKYECDRVRPEEHFQQDGVRYMHQATICQFFVPAVGQRTFWNEETTV